MIAGTVIIGYQDLFYPLNKLFMTGYWSLYMY